MKIEAHSNELIPAALLAEVEAIASAERRPASEVLRDAIEGYLHGHGKAAPASPEASRPTEAQKRAAQEAGERILERRQFRHLPEGVTIRELINFGRA